MQMRELIADETSALKMKPVVKIGVNGPWLHARYAETMPNVHFQIELVCLSYHGRYKIHLLHPLHTQTCVYIYSMQIIVLCCAMPIIYCDDRCLHLQGPREMEGNLRSQLFRDLSNGSGKILIPAGTLLPHSNQ